LIKNLSFYINEIHQNLSQKKVLDQGLKTINDYLFEGNSIWDKIDLIRDDYVSIDNLQYAFLLGDGNINSFELYSINGRELKNVDDNVNIYKYSRDEDSIAYVKKGFGVDAKDQLYFIDKNGENKTLLAELPNINDFAWSNDGRYIALISDEGVNSEIWLVKTDKSLFQRLTNGASARGGIYWSRNDGIIAFTSDTDYNLKTPKVYTINISLPAINNTNESMGISNGLDTSAPSNAVMSKKLLDAFRAQTSLYLTAMQTDN
jgi:Tol biopolymer transport system component